MNQKIITAFLMLFFSATLFSQKKIILTVNTQKTFQQIDGFGAFNTLSSWKNTPAETKYQLLANDLGLSILRFELPPTFHEYKDSSNNLKALVFGGPDLQHNFADVRALNKLGVKKFIASIWSPPAWMKSLNTEGQGPTTKLGGSLREDAYQDFAEYCVAYCKTFKEQTGVELYALGLQNEPEFSEPYNSCIYTPAQMREALRHVARQFAKDKIATKLYLPEALPAQNHLPDFFKAINEDEETKNFAEIFAIHNYDVDGINVGGAGSKEWETYAQIASCVSPQKKLWMTETSGHANNWQGAMLLAANLYNALHYGNLSAWLWWAIADQKSSEQFALIVDGKPTSRYYISRHFYKYVRPGATRVDAETGDADILTLAFTNSGNHKLVAILINKGDKPAVVMLPKIEATKNIYLSTEKKYGALQNNGGSPLLNLPAKSIATITWD